MTTVPAYVPASGDAATSQTPGVLATPTTPTPTAPVPTLSGASTRPTAMTPLDASIASKPLSGDTTAATPSKPYDEKQLVQELATSLGVKAKKGSSLEAGVVDTLAKKYDVHLRAESTTTKGTGTGQGEVGQLRHDIADWFDNMPPSTHDVLGAGKNKVAEPGAEDEQQVEQQTSEAMKIKDPKLREQALAKIKKDQASDTGTPAATPEPVDVENKKALSDIVTQVGEKLGVQATGPNALGDVAQAQGLPTGTPATPGRQQTAGEAYQSFVKQLADSKTSAKTAAGVVPLLEQAGLLDRNETTAASSTKQANGTTYTNAQIANAYQQVLTTAIQNNQSQDAALNSLAQKGSDPNAPTSEMEAYVQGIATEFGVGLTTQQITEIANTYGQNAATADDPSSVTDEIKDAVMSLYDPTNPNNPAGVADTMFTNIQQAALSYQIPISAQQIGNMVKQDLQGATVQSVYATADAAQSAAIKQFQEQAQGLYPALSDQIKSGQTVQNLVAPYFNVAEAITGVPASTMMADNAKGGLSKWSAFLQGGNDTSGQTAVAPGASATGSKAQAGPQMMTLDQWRKYLMQTPQYGFDKTQGGIDMGEQLSSAILNEFGKVNTTSGSPFSQYSPQSDLSANTSSG